MGRFSHPHGNGSLVRVRNTAFGHLASRSNDEAGHYTGNHVVVVVDKDENGLWMCTVGFRRVPSGGRSIGGRRTLPWFHSFCARDKKHLLGMVEVTK